MTTNEAFEVVLYDGSYYGEQDNKGKDRIRNLRRNHKKGGVTLETKIVVIKDFGFVEVTEMSWRWRASFPNFK